MRRGWVMLAVGVALAGCSNSPDPSDRYFGFKSGPLPAAQPFVAATRPRAPTTTPSVFGVPGPRPDPVLDTVQQKQLEASLRADAVTPAPLPGSPPPRVVRRKPRVTSKSKPIF